MTSSFPRRAITAKTHTNHSSYSLSNWLYNRLDNLLYGACTRLCNRLDERLHAAAGWASRLRLDTWTDIPIAMDSSSFHFLFLLILLVSENK
jgi:hypothetical protein